MLIWRKKKYTMKKMILTCTVACGFVAAVALAEDGKADGKALFEGKCAICHGKDGAGKTKMGEKAGIKDLTDPKYQATLSDEKMLKSLKEGIKDGEKTKMKAYDKILGEEELKAVIAYVRTLAKK